MDELSVLEVRLDLAEWMDRLGIDSAFAERHLNEGFSGGERKRNEVLQMALLDPVIALLDETDSGLDIDALRVVAQGVRTVREQHPDDGCRRRDALRQAARRDPPRLRARPRSTDRSSTVAGPSSPNSIDHDGYDAWRPVNA